MDATVLIADDDSSIRQVLSKALIRAGCRVHATSLLTTLARWVEEGRGDVVITDVMMPDGDGLETVRMIRRHRPDLPIIVISARNTILTAIGAEEADAFSYLPKPFDLPDILRRVGQAVERRRGGQARQQMPAGENLPMIGRTPIMQSLYQFLAKIMNVDTPVMILGESGSGKSHVAQVIHDISDRRMMPFVNVGFDFPRSPAEMLARMNSARGGTLLIDEIGNLDLHMQAALSVALDSEFADRPRLVSTTRQDLHAQIEAGRFREDLFFRLNGIPVEIPPLRNRLDDIPLLADSIFTRIEREGGSPKGLSDGALRVLRSYSWPGNVRQLDNILQQLAATSLKDEISEREAMASLIAQPSPPTSQSHTGNGVFGDLLPGIFKRHFEGHGADLPPPGLYSRVIREVERSLFAASLEATEGNRASCAEMLGLNRNTLRKKLSDLGVPVVRRKRLR